MMRIAAAFFSALSLGSLLVVGLDQRSLFGESSAPARSNLPNVSSLTENVRRYGPEQIEELLLVAAPQPQQDRLVEVAHLVVGLVAIALGEVIGARAARGGAAA